MSTSTSEPAETAPRPIPAFVDWLVSGLLVLAGLVGMVAGVLVAGAADREWSADLVAEMENPPSSISEETLVETVYNLALWGGRGLAVTGLLLAVGGVAFLSHRRRAPEEARPDAVTCSVLGAVVTVLASFVPFSPVIGGGVAGYFGASEWKRGVFLGALAGLVVTAPAALIAAFLLWGMVVAGTAGVGFILLVALAFSAVFSVGLSAAGGYVGVYIANDW